MKRKVWTVQNSDIHGKGIHAIMDIAKEQSLGIAYTLIGKVNNQFIAGEIHELGMFVNHSKMPSAQPRLEGTSVILVSLHKIKSQSEITVNYNDFVKLGIVNLERPQW